MDEFCLALKETGNGHALSEVPGPANPAGFVRCRRRGDGDINRPGEECDQIDLGGRTYDSLGLGGGSLGCTTTCKLQTAGCASSGAADPRSITLGPSAPVCSGQSQTVPVSLGFPAGSVIDKVDVFLLFDDTGSFAGTVPSVTQIFSQLVDQLQTALPQVSFGFGVGRFEDYGGPGTTFSSEVTTGRPFTLNQPIVTPDVPDFLNLINSALNRTAPGFGGDGPETTLEALFQISTGAGFDGNGNASRLDSGAAGASLTQTSPGVSGDIPPFSSNVAAASGTLGGVGYIVQDDTGGGGYLISGGLAGGTWLDCLKELAPSWETVLSVALALGFVAAVIGAIVTAPVGVPVYAAAALLLLLGIGLSGANSGPGPVA